MATPAYGYGATSATDDLKYMTFERRAPGPDDVSIKIAFCGVCHSDLHTVRDEWGGTAYPMIPGHEIVGHVTAVGSKVTKFKVGDAVGVGCLVNTCSTCRECKSGLEQYCKGLTQTYNARLPDGSATMGGYSDHIVVKEFFVLRIPKELPLDKAAPLLCAGITTYSPLRHWNVKKGTKVGVVGLGGLGHMAVKLAKAMGADVSVFTSESKSEDAKRLGAQHVIISKDAEQVQKAAGTLDVIVDTVGTQHNLSPYVSTLAVGGTHVLVGVPEKAHPALHPGELIVSRRSVAGSAIGSLEETQEMLDFCAANNITADIEVISIDYINTAYERMLKSDIKYRFVIDMASLQKK